MHTNRHASRMTAIGWTLAATLAASGVALTARGQTLPAPNPPLVIRSVAGADLFRFYCATCHGRDGKGEGPAAAALKVAPPDLTLIARRQGGTFPRERVEAFVANDGEPLIAAHGSAEMPVWGPVFRGLDPSDTMAQIRIANVVAYLRSIQIE